jgi:predicted phosphate transport protein (TIGR00153 family)
LLVFKTWFSWIRGNDKIIIGNLEKQGEILVRATSDLVSLLSNYDKNDLTQRASTIKELEHEGDRLTHELFTLISATFVTPLDREDISGLASSIDEVLDFTDGVADRFLLFKINKPSPYMLQLSKILFLASQEIYHVLCLLGKIKNSHKLMEYCNSIKKYEHEADGIYRNAIAELFELNDNPIEVIKLKEIYENLEESVDKCQDVADIVEDIALKYG